MSDGAAERAIARLANFRQPTPDEIQRGIREAMAGVLQTPNGIVGLLGTRWSLRLIAGWHTGLGWNSSNGSGD